MRERLFTRSSEKIKVQNSKCKIKEDNAHYVRLSGYEWLIVAVIILALFYFGPKLWERMEKFEPEPDYRMPYELSNDYWLYGRYCRWACSQDKTLVVGDSVIWGHYVSKENTLSHYLNKIASRDMFVNLGVDGIHPAALVGLLKYHGRDISGKSVILHLNPLWMSSRKHDLQLKKEFRFNHPRLVPQFIPNIPCYKNSYSKRISAVVERYVPFLSWASHIKITYFENMDLPTWTLQYPYDVPKFKIQNSKFKISRPEDTAGTAKRDFQWVELETSLQWSFFQRSIEMLRARGNRVFVLIGPFNEHMLKAKSIEIYRKIKSEIEFWLQQNNVTYYMPPALPSEFYHDASHPLSEGYAMLAQQLFENQSFRSNFIYVNRLSQPRSSSGSRRGGASRFP